MKVNERFIWAIDVLNIDPADKLLEIGCGAGILVEQIASKLDTGDIIAIDKSESMIRMASKKNAGHISTGKVQLIATEFSKSIFKKPAFDKVVAFNVNFFWKNPEKELHIIRQCLKPKGRLYVFYQAPYDINIKAADPIKEKLERFSFGIEDILFKKLKPTSAFCILSKPSPN